MSTESIDNPYFKHALGQALLICSSPSCKLSPVLTQVVISSVPDIPGCGQYRCAKCNRLFLVCLSCQELPGRSCCYLVEQDREDTFYSRPGQSHFRSSAHMTSLLSADSAALPHREESDVEDQSHGAFDVHDNADYNNYNMVESMSGADRIRKRLEETGRDPQPIDFSSDVGLFPKMPAASRYFGDEHNSHGSGTNSIVCQALGRSIGDKNIHPKEAVVNMKLYQLCQSIGLDKSGELFDIINTIRHEDIRLLTQQQINVSPDCYRIAIPDGHRQVRRMYFEGGNSISQQLPMPFIEEVANEVTYCSVTSVLRHAMAFDTDNQLHSLFESAPADIHSSPDETPRAAEIFRRSQAMRPNQPSYVLQAWYWEDDADMNTTKSDRGSVHISTITLSSKGSSQFTYILSIGAKDADYEPVRRRIVEELNELSGSRPIAMYHGGLRKVVHVYLQLNACLVDRVARVDLSGASQGNGKYSAVWGLAADMQAVHNKIPLCSVCLSATLDGRSIDNPCETCDGWHYRLDSDLLLFPPPTGFPDDMIPSGTGGKLRPVRVSSNLILDRIKVATQKIQSGNWNARTADAYLRTSGLSQSVRDNAIQAMVDRRSVPTPAILGLNGVDVCCHADTVMHLVYLGISKYLLKYFSSLMKLRGKTNLFHENVAPHAAVISSYRLEWLKFMPSRHGKLGGWVAENFLAFDRIAGWYALHSESMLVINEEVADPEGHPIDYNLYCNSQYNSDWTLMGHQCSIRKAGCVGRHQVKITSNSNVHICKKFLLRDQNEPAGLCKHSHVCSACWIHIQPQSRKRTRSKR